MRYFLKWFSIVFCTQASAQDLPWVKIDTSRKPKKIQPDFLSQHSVIGKNRLGTIYQLKQDNMPCIVPDTAGLRKIPNAIGRTYLSAVKSIPNGYSGKFPD